MSRKRKGGRRDEPKAPLSPEDQYALDLLGPERPSDREALEMFRRKMGMRIGDQTREVTVNEALNHKVLQAAMAGNSHAAWLLMEQREKAEEAERARKLDDLALWLGVQRRNREAIEAAQSRGEPGPRVFPHPDDIVVNADKEVVILGPCDATEHAKMLEFQQQRNALVAHYVMERVQDGKRWFGVDAITGTLQLAVICNRVLPPRLRWGPQELAAELDRLMALPKRVLLKEARQKMAGVGLDPGRGKKLDPHERLTPYLMAMRPVCEALVKNPKMPDAELVDRLAQAHLSAGIPVKGYPPPD